MYAILVLCISRDQVWFARIIELQNTQIMSRTPRPALKINRAPRTVRKVAYRLRHSRWLRWSCGSPTLFQWTLSALEAMWHTVLMHYNSTALTPAESNLICRPGNRTWVYRRVIWLSRCRPFGAALPSACTEKTGGIGRSRAASEPKPVAAF